MARRGLQTWKNFVEENDFDARLQRDAIDYKHRDAPDQLYVILR